MAFLQKTRILPNERQDRPDYNKIEDFVCADFKAIHKFVWTSENFVVSGFEATGVGTNTLDIEVAGAAAIFGADDGTMYIGAPTLSTLSTDTLTPGTTNYVEILVDLDTGGADSRAFWDQTAGGGTGGEFSQIIDTFIFQDAVFAINTSNFTNDPDKLPICEVDVNGAGVITEIRDGRNFLYRLGRRGDPEFSYSWASRTEPADTQFTGADKDLKTLKNLIDAILTTFKELKGVTHWYELAGVSLTGGFRNAALSVITGANASARFSWDGSNIAIKDSNLTPATTDVVAHIRLLDSSSDLDLTRQDFGTEVVTIDLDAIADAGTLTLDQDGNLIAIDWDDDTAAIQATWDGAASEAAVITGSPAEGKITITYTTVGNKVDVITDSNTLTKSAVAVNETITITQGQASDNSIPLADGEVLWVELPDPLANTQYSGTGVTSTNYRVSARGSVPLDETSFWIAYREGANVYIRGLGELEPGEEAEISDNVNENILQIIGVPNETSVPAYSSTNVLTQGINLVGGMGQLDAAIGNTFQDRTLKVIEGGTWSLVDNAGTYELTLSADAYVQIPELDNVRNTIQAATISLPNADSVAYVSLNREDGAADNLTVTVADIDAVPLDVDTLIIARRVSDGVLVGASSFLLKPGEYLELDGALAEINRLLGQLKIVAHESDADKVRISAADVALLDGNTLTQVIGDFILSFDGAVIDFTTGEVFESDGVTPLGNDFTPFTIPAGEYFWYGLSLLPGTITADNRQLATIQVDLASAADAVQGDAPFPVISGDVKRGAVQVQNNGGNVEVVEIRRLGTGAGSGSGAGGGSARDFYEDRLNFSIFNLVSTNIFREDQDDFVDGSSTGEYSPADRAFKFSAIGETLIDTNNAIDTDFLTSELDISEIELYLHWQEGAVDTLATYEVSRNGGNEWQTVTMERVGSTNAYRGFHIFDTEAAKQNLDAQGTPDTTRTLTDTGADQALAVPFTPSTVRVFQEVDVELNKLGTPVGTYVVKLVKDDGGAPSTDPSDIVSESNQLNVADLSSGDNTVTVDMPDKVLLASTQYWLVIETDAAYKASFSAAVDELRIRADGSAPVADGASFNGTVWSATVGEAWAFQAKGREIDLRVRVTAGAADTLIESYGIYYEQQPGISVADGKLEIDEFIFSGDENRTQFTLVNISNPNPDLLEIKDVFRGQEYIAREGVCRIDGQTVTFDPDFFDDPGEDIHLVFKQLKAGVIDNSDENANKIATINSQLIDIGDQLESVSDSMVLAKIAAPFTTVQNRSLMPDLSSDLKPRFGVDRIMCQEAFELQNETGPNGEKVFGVVNDRFNQIRFVGSTWLNNVNVNGQRIVADGTNEGFVEITFYGTGLNVLVFTNTTTRSLLPTIDGGAEGSEIYPQNTSSALVSRNYSQNIVAPVVSGLSLGLHTIKLRTPMGLAQIYGFEVLNESTDLQLLPGAQLFKGRRLVKPTLTTTSYNSDFETGTLGSKGGHVLVYQKSDGTVAKAVTPTDATQLNLAAANHANEEIIRKINFREFGAGRADDFSTLTGTDDVAFTLDDGTTTLVGNDVGETQDGVYIAGGSSGNFWTITFVGTGLDIITPQVNTIDIEYSLIIDGTTVATGLSDSELGGGERVIKLVSGLPYGTHTVRLVSTNTGTIAALASDFIIYGPKTPALPTGAKAISDYFIMADFVAPSGNEGNYIAQGTLVKPPIREFVYVQGGSGTADWSVIGVNTNYQHGFLVNTDRQSGYVEYTFFGTGISMMYETGVGGTYSADITVLLDGIAADVNHPESPTYSVVGEGSYDSSAGNARLNSVGTGTRNNSLVISGLSLGLHTIRMTQNTNADFFNFMGAQIIVPIHSPKENGPYILQNVAEIGSQGIRDLRRFSKKDVTKRKQISKSLGLDAPSSPGATPVPLNNMVATIKTTGGDLKIEFDVDLGMTGVSSASLYLYLDGKLVKSNVVTNNGFTQTKVLQTVIPVSPGFHVVQVFWSNSGGSMNNNSQNRSLILSEEKVD